MRISKIIECELHKAEDSLPKSQSNRDQDEGQLVPFFITYNVPADETVYDSRDGELWRCRSLTLLERACFCGTLG